MALCLGLPGWGSTRKKHSPTHVKSANGAMDAIFWVLWCNGKITEADASIIQLDATPSGLLVTHLHHLQATSYASQHTWCLSQARMKWKGYSRKGIQHYYYYYYNHFTALWILSGTTRWAGTRKITRGPAVARRGRPYCRINLILTISPSLIDF